MFFFSFSKGECPIALVQVIVWPRGPLFKTWTLTKHYGSMALNSTCGPRGSIYFNRLLDPEDPHFKFYFSFESFHILFTVGPRGSIRLIRLLDLVALYQGRSPNVDWDHKGSIRSLSWGSPNHFKFSLDPEDPFCLVLDPEDPLSYSFVRCGPRGSIFLVVGA